MKMKRVRMSDLFTTDIVYGNGYGIFSELGAEDNDSSPIYPLIHEFIEPSNSYFLDMDYHIGFSSDKYISPLLFKLLEKILQYLFPQYTIEDVIDHTIPQNDLVNILKYLFQDANDCELGHLLYNRFADKWKKLWDAITAQYNPLENYDMTQERTPDIVHEDVYDVTDERTADLTDTENGQISKNVDSESGVYGFNSTGANPSDNNSGNETTNINNHTTATSGTDTNVKSGSITSSETGSEKLTRHGNIGVTSSQQLLESEFEVRKKDFYKIIYNDIDSVLCLKCY